MVSLPSSYRLLFDFSLNGVLSCGHVPAHLQDVGFAADLAVFNIALPHAGRDVDGSLIPLSTSGTLKA